jgi:hypothetical protein
MAKNKIVKLTDYSGMVGAYSVYYFNIEPQVAKERFMKERNIKDATIGDVIEFDDSLMMTVDSLGQISIKSHP